jgi:hypothetical protein
MGFLSPSKKTQGQYLISGHDRSLPHILQSIQPTIQRSLVRATDSIAKKTTNGETEQILLISLQFVFDRD